MRKKNCLVACFIACLATLVAALLTIGWRGDARAQSGGQPPPVATTQPPNLGSELFALKTVITLPGSPLSSFDIVWLDRCPLLNPVRNALDGVRARVAARAERVVNVFRLG